MINKNNKKEIIVAVILILGGAAFTATSFCVYYLVKPRIAAVLAIICVADFLYCNLCTCIFCKYLGKDKWLLKGLLCSVIYVAAFIIVALILGVFALAFDFIKNNMLVIVFYAFFTGPSIFLIVSLVVLCLAFY